MAKLFSDRKTAAALSRAFTQRLCAQHERDLGSLKDLKLLHLSEAIRSCYPRVRETRAREPGD